MGIVVAACAQSGRDCEREREYIDEGKSYKQMNSPIMPGHFVPGMEFAEIHHLEVDNAVDLNSFGYLH